MQERILIVEDDEGQARLTRLQLEQAGYEVRTAALGSEGVRLAREWKPHLVLLDVLMPDTNGWTVYQQIRGFTEVPVCFTTALGEDQDISRGLDLGADDYIIKPYSYKELIARVRASLHRSQRTVEEPPLEIGSVRIDPGSHRVWLKERPIHLTPKEFRLLLAMARHAGQVVTHKELQCQVWGSDDPGTRSRLKLYVWYLRRKLEADPAHPRLVLSERGVGYRLATPEPEEPS